MPVGISDKISKADTTDMPEEEYLVHARHRPWDGWQGLLERSPIYDVQKARTPLLILHGKDDLRVFPAGRWSTTRFLEGPGGPPPPVKLDSEWSRSDAPSKP